MILTSWKEISSHLHCSIRTAQRWEHDGMPVNRPLPSHRSVVVADSEALNSWLRGNVPPRKRDAVRLQEIQRTSQLREIVGFSFKNLQEKLILLRTNQQRLRANVQLLRRCSTKREATLSQERTLLN